MPKLSHLRNLEIRGFRAFQKLSIPKLSQVNLIVGRNNSGKTSLLEALLLYFSQSSRQRINELLTAREEFSFQKARKVGNAEEVLLAYESLFFGRPQLEREAPSFRIGTQRAQKKSLTVSFTWLQPSTDDVSGITRYRTIAPARVDDAIVALPGLNISTTAGRRLLLPFDRIDRISTIRSRTPAEEYPIVFLPSVGMSSGEVGRIWDSVALTVDEDQTLAALRLISKDIEKLVLVQSPRERASRILMAKLTGFRDPVPFKSLGEGVNHLLNIFLALIRARDGVLLIDEIENGIHYSVQSELWKLILKQAADWNAQVFATTHSMDCVKGFDVALESQRKKNGILLRLEGEHGNMQVVSFNPNEIEILNRERIEVR